MTLRAIPPNWSTDPTLGPWKCFFCGEVFADGVTAGRHFGEPEGCECPVPGCVDPLRRDEKARLHELRLARYEAAKAIDERDALYIELRSGGERLREEGK